MKAKKRTYNLRRIRIGQSYTVQEIAELFGIHKNALSRWIKDGLRPTDQRKPYLIHGSVLAEYLRKKQSGRKQKCTPEEFYCCKCRVPRRAWENVADIKIQNEAKLFITGICAICETFVNRMGATGKLAEYQKTFTIQTIHDERIRETAPPTVNSDMRKDA